MSLVNIAQMIEKEKQTGTPQTYWRSKDNRQHEVEKSLVFNNCLTKAVIEFSHGKIKHLKTDPEDKNDSVVRKHDDISSKDLQEDMDINSNTDESDDETDDTDYFDSEDEYWSNLGNKNIDDNPTICPYCISYHLPRSVNETKGCYYEEVYDLSPWCTPAILKFAKDNDFEIKDVYGDGNCLFRAVADQFMINGCPGHTEVSLRETAIEHLENSPSKYGVHVSSFLSGETWEDYLKRMKKPGEWGDHIILQALADVFLLHISVYSFIKEDIRRTDITTEQILPVTSRFCIALGHVRERHYCSLRPTQWLAELPYKSQIFRMLVTNTEQTLGERTKHMDRKFTFMTQGNFPESHLAEPYHFVLQCILLQDDQKADLLQSNLKPVFISYNGIHLQQEETEESQKTLLENQSHVDSMSGIPLHHLTFIMTHVFPYKMAFKEFFISAPFFCTENVMYHFLGSVADESFMTLRDITRTRKMWAAKKRKIGRVVVLKQDKVPIFLNDDLTQEHIPGRLYVVCSDTHPGYCRLRLSSPDSSSAMNNTEPLGSNMFQKAFTVPEGLASKIKLPNRTTIHCIGVWCLTFPFDCRWKQRKPKCDFPSQSLVRSIIKTGCTLIPRSHPKSSSPEIEWQLDFSMAEHHIFRSMTVSQIHGFFVLKVLVDNMVHHLPLKTKHLKSVFLMACETIPSGVWETNFSGCVLQVLNNLLSCLKRRFLPNFFIPENNLIDCHREDDIITLCNIIEYIRLFPSSAIQVVAEKYGYTYGSNLIKRVLSNVKEFNDKKNFHDVFNNIFGPLTLATAKVMAKMGFYDVSLDILEQRFEQSLLIPDTKRTKHQSVNFSDLFWSAVMEMKQKASRVLLARLYDTKMGSNISKMILKKTKFCLQTYLPWTVDKKISWIAVPSEHVKDFAAIADFLYQYSKREYWRRNVDLAELTITASLKCIKETLNIDSVFGENIEHVDVGLKTDLDSHRRAVMKKLIPYYVHLFSIVRLDFLITPLNDHLDDIEKLCNEFPEMSGFVSSIFGFTRQHEKEVEYAKKMAAYFYGKDMTHFPDSSILTEIISKQENTIDY